MIVWEKEKRKSYEKCFYSMLHWRQWYKKDTFNISIILIWMLTIFLHGYKNLDAGVREYGEGGIIPSTLTQQTLNSHHSTIPPLQHILAMMTYPQTKWLNTTHRPGHTTPLTIPLRCPLIHRESLRFYGSHAIGGQHGCEGALASPYPTPFKRQNCTSPCPTNNVPP